MQLTLSVRVVGMGVVFCVRQTVQTSSTAVDASHSSSDGARMRQSRVSCGRKTSAFLAGRGKKKRDNEIWTYQEQPGNKEGLTDDGGSDGAGLYGEDNAAVLVEAFSGIRWVEGSELKDAGADRGGLTGGDEGA